jgi:endo-1,4-beta-D-glucanase Y
MTLKTNLTRLTIIALLVAQAACGGDGGGGDDDTGGSGGKGGKGGSGSGGKGTGGSGSGGKAMGGSGSGGNGMGGADTGEGGSDTGSGGTGTGGAAAGGSGPGAGGSDTGGGTGGMPVTHATAHPFGSHAFKYPAGVIKPTGTAADLDKAVSSYYDLWQAKYLQARCGGYVVLTEGGTGAADGTFSVSEGHGYGMLITALMAGHDPKAQEKFDGLYKVFRTFPSTNTPDLMDWQILNKCPAGATCDEPAPTCFRIKGAASGSATDGDMDVAFGLLLADSQWGSGGTINYYAEARKVMAAIKAKEMNPTTKLPLLADDIASGDMMYFTTRPSDFMLDHFRSFGKASGDVFWMQSVDAIHALITKLQLSFASSTGLIPDFVVKTDGAPEPAPPMWPADEGKTTGEYAYNSCRVPWRVTTDFIASGDPRARAEVKKITDWMLTSTQGQTFKITDGYKLDGSMGSDAMGPDFSFSAPLAVAAIVDASYQVWLDRLWTVLVNGMIDSYYGDSIRMLSMIVITGNWWVP